jgi:PAS domain S-box-containing protein
MTEMLNHALNRRVLVIDDNRAIHDDFRKILLANSPGAALDATEAVLFGEPPSSLQSAGFEIDSAFQGQDGWERVHQALAAGRPYALAFIDVRMPPGWDGIETTARIWSIDPNLQVVICTAYSDYTWNEMLSKLGHSDRLLILKKPFDNVEVLQLVNALTDKWWLQQQELQQMNNLEAMVRQRTEELRSSEQRFRLITENAAELIAIVDPHGRRLYNSPSYQVLLGYSPEELRATPAFEQVHPDDRETVTAAARQTVETGSGRVLEYRMQHKDGSWRTFESHGAPFRNAAGLIEGVLIVNSLQTKDTHRVSAPSRESSSQAPLKSFRPRNHREGENSKIGQCQSHERRRTEQCQHTSQKQAGSGRS